jgi:hypothetical protein
VTVPSPALDTQTESPTAMPRGWWPTGIASPCGWPLWASRRVTESSPKFVTQTVSSPAAMSSGRVPTSIGEPVTWPVSRSIRVTVPSPAFVTQAKPSVSARDSGARPTGIRFEVPSSWIRSTASSPEETTHRIPSSDTSGLSGWRPAGSGLPRVLSSASIWTRRPAVASATQTTAPSSSTVIPSGPRPARIVFATVGSSPAAAVAVAVAVAVAATSVPATNAATALISGEDRRLPNAGIPPSPLVTICCTRWALGLASSRFGPDAPEEPAAASVWQPPQPADAKTALPDGAAAGWAAEPVVFLSAPISDGPTKSSSTTSPASTQVSGARMRSTFASTTATGTRCWR